MKLALNAAQEGPRLLSRLKATYWTEGSHEWNRHQHQQPNGPDKEDLEALTQSYNNYITMKEIHD